MELTARPKWLKVVLWVLSFYVGFMACNIALFVVAYFIRIRYGLNDQSVWALLVVLVILVLAVCAGIVVAKVQYRLLHSRPVRASYFALGVLIVASLLVTPILTLDVQIVEEP